MGSKTICEKAMNEYLAAEKEASACAMAECAIRTAWEHPVRKSNQAVAKRAHLSSSVGGSSQKKARREPKSEVLLHRASQPGLGSAKSEEEEEVAPPLIRSRRSRGPAILEGTKAMEGLSQNLC